MEEQIDNLTEELNNVARHTIKTYEQGTFAEQENARKHMQKFEEECADIFKYFMGVVPTRVIENISEQANELVKKQIGDSRTTELRETGSRLESVKVKAVDEMLDRLQYFQTEGIARDKEYDERLDEIMDRVVKAYKTVLERSQSRKAEEAFDEIKSSARKICGSMKDDHEECTEIIRREVFAKVDELGMAILSRQKAQIEEPKKGVADFATELQSNCFSDREIAASDVKEIDENEGSITTNKNTREDLDAMFR